jgi:hypothetical protein
MREYVLIVIGRDMQEYRVEVSAQSREEACREIVSVQMAKGCPVRSIRDAE